MRKIIVRITVVIGVIAILVALALGIAVLYARRNINYSLDEELFHKAKEEHTVYYYAYDDF